MSSLYSHSIHSQKIQEHNQHVIRPPTFSSKAIKKFFKTRFTTLITSKEERSKFTKQQVLNPFIPLREMTARQWSFFGVAYFAWTWDAFDVCKLCLFCYLPTDNRL